MQYPAPAINCTSINAHYSLFLMALAIGRLTLGGHNGLPPHVPQQTDWCKASQSPFSINRNKNISQARDRGDLQQFQPHLAHLRHFNMFSSEDIISVWCQMGTVRRKNCFTHNALHQDLPSTFLMSEHFLQGCYSQLNSTHVLLVPSTPMVSSVATADEEFVKDFLHSHTFKHTVLSLENLPVWQD